MNPEVIENKRKWGYYADYVIIICWSRWKCGFRIAVWSGAIARRPSTNKLAPAAVRADV